MKTFDAVIIGAGLAGLQCARLLGGSGARVLLVDRKTDLSKGVHTTGIFVRKTLEDFDFPAGTLGPAIRRVTLYSPRLKAIELESENDEFRVGKMGALYESMLRECLTAGVEFSNGTRYLGIGNGKPVDAPAANSAAHLCAGSPFSGTTIVRLEKSGSPFAVETKVLIGADGADSRVAKDLELDRNREWIVGCEEVFRAPGGRSGGPRLHCFLDRRLAPGYLAWVADDGEEFHVGVGGYAAQFNPREALRSFKEKVKGKFDLSGAEPIETRGGRIPVGGVLRRIAGERGLLIGDAAGAVSPLTAGGLDPALRLSRLAAEIVRERLKTGDPRVLLKFSGSLFRARFISRLWMRQAIKTLNSQTLLEIGFALVRSGAGRRLARHVFFGRGSFPDVETQTVKQSALKLIEK